MRLAWNIKAAEEKKYSFLNEYVELNTQTLAAFKEEYQLGRRTLLELLDMENEYQRAHKALVESKFSMLASHYRFCTLQVFCFIYMRLKYRVKSVFVRKR